MKKIAVVGAGISGLACAYELKKAGHDVVVFEKNDFAGGRMATRTKDDLPFDIGADHLANLYDHIKDYCKEFNIEFTPMDFVKYVVVKDGGIVDLGEVTGICGKLKLAFRFFRTKDETNFFDLSTAVKYDKDDGYNYAQAVLGKEAADYLEDPFTSTYQFHRGEKISKGAFVGIMESLKRERPRWHLHRLVGGMRALPDALASKLDMRYRVGVSNVKKNENGFTVSLEDGTKEEFDLVVMGTIAPVTNKLLDEKSEQLQKLLDDAKYAFSISVVYKVPVERLPKDISIFWVPYVESKKISGMVNELYKGSDYVSNGKSMLATWLHDEFAREVFNKSDGDIADEVRKEVARVNPFVIEEDLEYYDIQRWESAMPIFYPGWLTQVAEYMPSNGENGLYITGDYLNAPWTEGALRLGQRVATHIIKKTK